MKDFLNRWAAEQLADAEKKAAYWERMAATNNGKGDLLETERATAARYRRIAVAMTENMQRTAA